MTHLERYRPAPLEALSPPKGEIAQGNRLKQSLELIQGFTRQAGHELPIVSVRTIDEVADDPGVYIFSSRAEQHIEDTNFIPSTQLLSGTRDSGHAVISGSMTIERTGSVIPEEIDIAAKCFMKRDSSERLDRAKREVRVMQELGAAGELTFKPRSLVIGKPDKNGNTSVAVMTEFDRSIMSLDNHPWSSKNTKNVALAAQATHALGRFNAQGRLHGDAKIKNVAQDDMGHFGMIDFETSRDIDPQDPWDASWCATTDLHKMFDNLHDRGFFPTDPRRCQETVDVLTQSYLDAWQGSSDEVQSAVLEACTNVQSNFNTMQAQVATFRVALSQVV